jgi:S-adenosylmethionine/arginine decarboxylase-like enzyme
VEVCKLIDMERAKLCWWDDHGVPKEEQQTLPHTKGTTAVQFILTSNITIHTLDILRNVYVNIFSCKDFDEIAVEKFTKNWFKGIIVNSLTIKRI